MTNENGSRNESSFHLTSPQMTTPVLMMFVLIAMYLSRYLLSGAEANTNLFLSISVIQLLVLVLPCMLYYLLKGKKLASPMFLSPIGLRHLPMLLFASLVLILGTLLIKFGYQAIASVTADTTGFFDRLTKDAADRSPASVLLALVIIPAVCEELFFRGVVLSEYRSMGEANAVIMSAVGFAMLHFSLTNFPVYLFVGLLLGIVTIVSRSVIPAVVLHLLSNTLSVFASDQFLRIILQKNGAFFVSFLMIVLLGFSVFLLLYSIEHLYLQYAEHPPTDSRPPKSRPSIAKVFLSPAFLVLIVVFALMTALQ